MVHADLVFAGGAYGGRVFRSDASRGRGDAVAVRGGRIVAVGADAAGLIGPSTEVIDLDGRLLVPGFQDAHVHPLWGGLDMLRCDLSELATEEQYLARIRAYVAEHPHDEWLLGGGWQMSAFPGGTPTAAALDRAVADRGAALGANRTRRELLGGTARGDRVDRALDAAGIGPDHPSLHRR